MQSRRSRAFAFRSLLLFGFWLLLLEPDSLSPVEIGLDWAVGAFAAISAALVSLRLLPPAARGPRLWPLVRYLLRFLVQSLLTVLSGLLRILRRPGDAERVMAAQLLGTGGVAALLLLGSATDLTAATDLVLLLLAALVAVAFVAGLSNAPPAPSARPTSGPADRQEPAAANPAGEYAWAGD